jgi:hypothetical protein
MTMAEQGQSRHLVGYLYRVLLLTEVRAQVEQGPVKVVLQVEQEAAPPSEVDKRHRVAYPPSEQ